MKRVGRAPSGQIESHSWESANIRRGQVNVASLKAIVFLLPFFSQLCDMRN